MIVCYFVISYSTSCACQGIKIKL